MVRSVTRGFVGRDVCGAAVFRIVKESDEQRTGVCAEPRVFRGVLWRWNDISSWRRHGYWGYSFGIYVRRRRS